MRESGDIHMELCSTFMAFWSRVLNSSGCVCDDIRAAPPHVEEGRLWGVGSIMDDLQDLSAAIDESAKQLGYTLLKEKQKEAAMAVLSGCNTFVALPTGYEKSVVYALLPKAFDIYRG